MSGKKKILIGAGIVVVLGGVAFANIKFKRNPGIEVTNEAIKKRRLEASVTASGQSSVVSNLAWSIKKGKKAPVNPWEATTLEWTIPSPPPFDNFAGKHPVVNHGPYEYSVPGAPTDHTMQSDPA